MSTINSIRPTIITIQSWDPRIPIIISKTILLNQRRLLWKFNSGKSCCFKDKKRIRSLTSNSMSESFRTRDGSNGDGGIRVLEQEGLINGSSSNLGADDGFEAKLNNLSKWLVTALFGVIILWRHDAEALWATAGSVINVGLSTVLKRILNQERPIGNLRPDPGMPSSHAQSISFAVIFSILSVVQWLGLNGITAALSGLFVALGSYFSWLRVSQKLHTMSQVVVGAVVGTIFSVLWFWSWDSFVLKAFKSFLWVRIIVVLGASVVCVGFLLYILRYWVMERITLYMSTNS